MPFSPLPGIHTQSYTSKLDSVEHRINKNHELLYAIVKDHSRFNLTVEPD